MEEGRAKDQHGCSWVPATPAKPAPGTRCRKRPRNSMATNAASPDDALLINEESFDDTLASFLNNVGSSAISMGPPSSFGSTSPAKDAENPDATQPGLSTPDRRTTDDEDTQTSFITDAGTDSKEHPHIEEYPESAILIVSEKQHQKKRQNPGADLKLRPRKKFRKRTLRPKVILEGNAKTAKKTATFEPKTPKKITEKRKIERRKTETGAKRALKVTTLKKTTEKRKYERRKTETGVEKALQLITIKPQSPNQNLKRRKYERRNSIKAPSTHLEYAMNQLGHHHVSLEENQREVFTGPSFKTSKKRSLRRRRATMSWPSNVLCGYFEEPDAMKKPREIESQNIISTGSPIDKCVPALHHLVRKVTKKRSQRTTRRRDLACLSVLPKCNEISTTDVRCNKISTTDAKCSEISTGAGCNETSTTDVECNEISIPGAMHRGLACAAATWQMDSIDSLIEKLKCLHVSDRCNQIVLKNPDEHDHKLVPYSGKFDPTKKRPKYRKVDIDPETLRVWTQLERDGNERIEGDKDTERWWKEEREIFRGRVDSFIARMNVIQGDRRFTKWKGSVLDSIVGVFLTQNVSDYLSSTAFMSLAAKFPVQPAASQTTCSEDGEIINSKESVGSNTECPDNALNHEKLVHNETKQNANHQSERNKDGSPITEASGASSVESVDNLNGVNDETSKKKKGKAMQKEPIDWDSIRKTYSHCKPGKRTEDTMDSVDWEAVRVAPVNQVAKAIEGRGQNNILAGRIQDFLNRVVKDHGSLDLEWLRDIPPQKAKEYLLSIFGLGLKSTECVRLLSLHQKAMPVDTHASRACVRLGWVPLQPLPGDIQIHLLEQYPILDSVQKYLWPRLCVLDQKTLYEFHYQMITFGKVFCTKRKPNCNACPMKAECKHFANACASAKLALPASQEEGNSSMVPTATFKFDSVSSVPSMSLAAGSPSPSPGVYNRSCEPIIEEPATPEAERPVLIERDIEDLCSEDSDEFMTIKLNKIRTEQSYMEKYNMTGHEDDTSRALVVLNYRDASIPAPKLKNIRRLRTEHQVYELPDSHPLLDELDRREPDDPCPYLLAIWEPGEKAKPSEDPKKGCDCEASAESCNWKECSSCEEIQKQNSSTVLGTILIPCRTAMRGRFPLNGTYFQVNEVFAEYESSLRPINVPRAWIWNLRRRTLYCGATASAISSGFSQEEIQRCFRNGFICVRGFSQKTREPKHLPERFHRFTYKPEKPSAATKDE